LESNNNINTVAVDSRMRSFENKLDDLIINFNQNLINQQSENIYLRNQIDLLQKNIIDLEAYNTALSKKIETNSRSSDNKFEEVLRKNNLNRSVLKELIREIIRTDYTNNYQTLKNSKY
jgi:hypothetical protein